MRESYNYCFSKNFFLKYFIAEIYAEIEVKENSGKIHQRKISK